LAEEEEFDELLLDDVASAVPMEPNDELLLDVIPADPIDEQLPGVIEEDVLALAAEEPPSTVEVSATGPSVDWEP